MKVSHKFSLQCDSAIKGVLPAAQTNYSKWTLSGEGRRKK